VPTARTIRYVIASGLTLYSVSCLKDAPPQADRTITILELVNSSVAPESLDDVRTPRRIKRCFVQWSDGTARAAGVRRA